MTTKTKTKTKTKKRRGPYRCVKCREYGHRADKCPHPHKFQTLLDSLPGDVALASLVPEQFQILAVIEGQTHQALLGAIEGNQKLVDRGLAPNNSMINAWTELARRQATIPKEAITTAREARQALLAAEDAYAKATQPIRDAIQPKEKSK